ncbi:MAG: type II secretion system F family protein [Rickettsiales bacterium]|nr:type II secretion system F family protein [Rickettsiales bacterium]
MEWLLLSIGLIILGYLGFVFLFPKAIPEESGAKTRNALKQLYENTQTADNDGGNDNNVLRDEFAEETFLVQKFYDLPFMRNFYVKMVQAGYQKKAAPFAVIFVAMLFVSTSFFLISGLGPAALFFGPLATYFLPITHFKRRIRKRNHKFIEQFPDVLDMIVRSVRSGFPITTAFKMVAENMDSPVREEFQQVVNEIAIGRTINDTLKRLEERIAEPDINFFVVVLTVQQETGGNLSEVISNLSNVIRKRKQLRMRIRAMTSEGRTTAVILGSLPFVIFFALYFLRRDYLAPLWEESAGQVLLGSALGLVALCMFIVNQMIDIDI